jgi:hypothetical protein
MSNARTDHLLTPQGFDAKTVNDSNQSDFFLALAKSSDVSVLHVKCTDWPFADTTLTVLWQIQIIMPQATGVSLNSSSMYRANTLDYGLKPSVFALYIEVRTWETPVHQPSCMYAWELAIWTYFDTDRCKIIEQSQNKLCSDTAINNIENRETWNSPQGFGEIHHFCDERMLKFSHPHPFKIPGCTWLVYFFIWRWRGNR